MEMTHEPLLFVITKIAHPGVTVRTTDVLVVPKFAGAGTATPDVDSQSVEGPVSKLRKLGLESQLRADAKRQAIDTAFRFIADRYNDADDTMYKMHEAVFIGAEEMTKRAPDLSSMQADIWLVSETEKSE